MLFGGNDGVILGGGACFFIYTILGAFTTRVDNALTHQVSCRSSRCRVYCSVFRQLSTALYPYRVPSIMSAKRFLKEKRELVCA